MKTAMRYLLMLALAGIWPPAAHSLELRLSRDRLTLEAQDVPLQDLLRRFAAQGVRVKVDPALSGRITASIRNEDVEKALGTVLDAYNYALIWRVVHGPLGPITTLAEIHVFVPGEKENMRPLVPPASETVGAVPKRPGAKTYAYVRGEFLLRFKPGTNPQAVQQLLASLGARVVDGLASRGIYLIRVGTETDIPALMKTLADNSLVQAAEPNYVAFAPTPCMLAPATATPTERTLSPAAKGTALAILDTGFKSSAGSDLQPVAWFDAYGVAQTPDDQLGHGTQMALIGSGAVLPVGAPALADTAVPVVAERVFDSSGYVTSFGILQAVDFAVAQGSRVISMSWGSSTESSFIAEALASATAQDVVLVAAAGNEPTGEPVYPAASANVLAVGATGQDGSVWSQSNYGDFLDLSAPGIAAFPVGYNGPPGTYGGTSVSAAYVSSVLAQYRTLHPEVSAADTIIRLKAALTDQAPVGWDPHTGFGVLDAAAVARFLK